MPRRLRTPVVGLFLLAPLVGEFLLGNLPVVLLFSIVILAPMYGGGALLIRELVRRRGLGWPSMLVLGLAYGLIEEGLVTQSLFNPDYAGERLLDPGYVGFLGTGLPWALFVLTLHVVGSTAAPIAVVESMSGERRTTPWLGRRGLWIAAALFVLGCALDGVFTYSNGSFVAPWPRLLSAAVLAAVLVGVALRLPRRGTTDANGRDASARPAPSARLAGGVVFVLVLASLLAVHAIDVLTPWGTVAAQVVLLVALAALIWTWSRRVGWQQRHVLALALGVFAAYAVRALTQLTSISVETVVDGAGDILLDAAMVWLAVVAIRRVLAGSAATLRDRSGGGT